MLTDFIHSDIHGTSGTKDVYFRNILGDRHSHRHRWNNSTGGKLRCFCNICVFAFRDFLSHIRQRGQANEFRHVIFPASIFLNIINHQKVICRFAANAKINLAKVNAFRGPTIALGLNVLQSRQNGWRRRHFKDAFRKNPTLGVQTIAHNHLSVRSGHLGPRCIVVLDHRIAPNRVNALQLRL